MQILSTTSKCCQVQYLPNRNGKDRAAETWFDLGPLGRSGAVWAIAGRCLAGFRAVANRRKRRDGDLDRCSDAVPRGNPDEWSYVVPVRTPRESRNFRVLRRCRDRSGVLPVASLDGQLLSERGTRLSARPVGTRVSIHDRDPRARRVWLNGKRAHDHPSARGNGLRVTG